MGTEDPEPELKFEGFLTKQAKMKLKTPKKYFFVLKNNTLNYFKSSSDLSDENLQGTVDFTQIGESSDQVTDWVRMLHKAMQLKPGHARASVTWHDLPNMTPEQVRKSLSIERTSSTDSTSPLPSVSSMSSRATSLASNLSMDSDGSSLYMEVSDLGGVDPTARASGTSQISSTSSSSMEMEDGVYEKIGASKDSGSSLYPTNFPCSGEFSQERSSRTTPSPTLAFHTPSPLLQPPSPSTPIYPPTPSCTPSPSPSLHTPPKCAAPPPPHSTPPPKRAAPPPPPQRSTPPLLPSTDPPPLPSTPPPPMSSLRRKVKPARPPPPPPRASETTLSTENADTHTEGDDTYTESGDTYSCINEGGTTNGEKKTAQENEEEFPDYDVIPGTTEDTYTTIGESTADEENYAEVENGNGTAVEEDTDEGMVDNVYYEGASNANDEQNGMEQVIDDIFNGITYNRASELFPAKNGQSEDENEETRDLYARVNKPRRSWSNEILAPPLPHASIEGKTFAFDEIRDMLGDMGIGEDAIEDLAPDWLVDDGPSAIDQLKLFVENLQGDQQKETVENGD
ncbi:hypothetical protein Bbelb_223820 [Branchiostoma belcheri]|nr:hypothetical protein Bbelb_223820 [Branchiostoma belcheri]